MKETRINQKTKDVLAGCIYKYMYDNSVKHEDLLKKATNPFPVGTGLLREILHQNKRVVKFHPSKQYALIMFFGIEDRFYYDAETKNYLLKEEITTNERK